MSRDHLTYAQGSDWKPGQAYQAWTDEPVEGFYATRLRFGGVRVGVRIWYGPPHEPWTGEEMDRSWRWQAHVNGRYIELDRVWPKCAGEAIDQAEYDYLSGLQAWAEKHAPETGMADPRKPLSPLHSPMVF